MDISVPGYSETSTTYYTIQITLDGNNTYVVRKRYSDFVLFQEELEKEMGEPSPVGLPPKKWIGNKNREVLDQRRRGLEIFLRQISKRVEWRESLAVQGFLDIGKHRKNAASGSRLKEDWIKGVTNVRELTHKLRTAQGVEERKISVALEAKLRELEGSLIGGAEDLGDGEYRRRRDVIHQLQQGVLTAKSNGHVYNVNDPSTASSRSSSKESLFETSNNSGRSRVLGGGGETARTRELNNSGLLQLQKQDMDEQEQVIQSLRQTIGRQKQLGEQINEELTLHNQLIDELDESTHSTSARINQAKRQVGRFL